MATWIWVVIAIAVVAVIALVAVGARKRKTAMLRERFGPEYDRAVENRDGREPPRPTFAHVRSSGLSSTSSRCQKPPACVSRTNGVTCRSASSISRRKPRLLPITSSPASWKRGVTR